jgi:hypothetical protein
VVVLGAETANELFPADVDPSLATIKIRGINFQVVGSSPRKVAVPLAARTIWRLCR